MACETGSTIQAQSAVVFGVEFCIGEGQNAVRFSPVGLAAFFPYKKGKMLPNFLP